jgi:hypothetical protein
MRRIIESGANWTPVEIVNGCDDFKIVSFNHSYNYGSSSWGLQTSSERHLIAHSSHLSAETTEVYSYFAQRVKGANNLFTVTIKNGIKESAATNVEVYLDSWVLKLFRQTATTRNQDRLFYSPWGSGLE